MVWFQMALKMAYQLFKREGYGKAIAEAILEAIARITHESLDIMHNSSPRSLESRDALDEHENLNEQYRYKQLKDMDVPDLFERRCARLVVYIRAVDMRIMHERLVSLRRLTSNCIDAEDAVLSEAYG